MKNEIIYHHGIKGQKWGIRRYQNEDGSLTAAGKKRYSEDSSYTEDASYTEAHTKKPVSQMSNEELKKINNRLQLEQQYNSLTRQKSKTKKAVDAFIKGGTTLAAIMAAYKGYKKAGSAAATVASPYLKKIGNMAVNELLERGLI